MKNLLGRSVNRLTTATRSALDRNNRLVGNGSSLSGLKLYSTMGPKEFDAIAQIYGSENLLRYIKHMEAERMKHGTAQ